MQKHSLGPKMISILLNQNSPHHLRKKFMTIRMPMHIRKLHHYKLLCSLNKCNIAQYSIVKHVTEINEHSLNYLILLNLVTVLQIAKFFLQFGFI